MTLCPQRDPIVFPFKEGARIAEQTAGELSVHDDVVETVFFHPVAAKNCRQV